MVVGGKYLLVNWDLLEMSNYVNEIKGKIFTKRLTLKIKKSIFYLLNGTGFKCESE